MCIYIYTMGICIYIYGVYIYILWVYVYIYIWTFPKMGVPLNDPLYFWIVHYKPFILGYLQIY